MKMHKTYMMLAAVLALGLGACDEQTTSSEITETSVVNGTEVESTTSTETTVDGEGNRSQTTESTTTVDPEGMMNKETVTEESTTEETHH